jgi:hypothetical protein
VASTREKLQLTLPKENDSSEETVKRSFLNNTPQQQTENPPKIRKSTIFHYANMNYLLNFHSEVPDKENQTNEDVILRRTQSFENDEK